MFIRYEDLTKNSQKTLFEICKFLKVKYDKKLSIPSIFGDLYSGNNFKNIKFKDISSINVNKWKKRINNFESEVIEYFFERFLLIIYTLHYYFFFWIRLKIAYIMRILQKCA